MEGGAKKNQEQFFGFGLEDDGGLDNEEILDSVLDEEEGSNPDDEEGNVGFGLEDEDGEKEATPEVRTNADLVRELQALEEKIIGREEIVSSLSSARTATSQGTVQNAKQELEALKAERDELWQTLRGGARETLMQSAPWFEDEVRRLEGEIAEQQEILDKGADFADQTAWDKYNEAEDRKAELEKELKEYETETVDDWLRNVVGVEMATDSGDKKDAPKGGNTPDTNAGGGTPDANGGGSTPDVNGGGNTPDANGGGNTVDKTPEEAERLLNEQIMQELGGETLKAIAVNTAADEKNLENIARQMAYDQLDYEKRVRAGEIAKTGRGLKKVGLVIANAVQNSGIWKSLHLRNVRRDVLEHMRETGSIYAQMRDGKSNYDYERGMTAGDASIIERFKNYIRAEGTEEAKGEDVLGAGDKMKGMDEAKSAELKGKLTSLVDKIAKGEAGAWEEYQGWVNDAREKGYFTGVGEEAENREISADNIMEMGVKVRNLAENLKENEAGLEKIRQYVAENTALYTAEAKAGINTKVNLEEMAAIAMKGGIAGVVGFSLIKRTVNSDAAKALGWIVGAGAVGGLFGFAKGIFDADSTMSQVDRAQALGREDSKKVGSGWIAKLNKKNLARFETVSVNKVLSEIGQFMERDGDGNWVLGEGAYEDVLDAEGNPVLDAEGNPKREINMKALRELAENIGGLRAAMAVAAEQGVDMVTYDVGVGDNLEKIEQQKAELNWALAEAMRILRINSDDEHDFSRIEKAMEENSRGEIEDEIRKVNKERVRYKAMVIAETALAGATIGAGARAAKQFIGTWIHEHGQGAEAIERNAAAAGSGASEVTGADDVEDALSGEGIVETAQGSVAMETNLAGRPYTDEQVETMLFGNGHAENAVNVEDEIGGVKAGVENFSSTTSGMGPVLRMRANGNYELMGDVDGDGNYERLKGLGNIKYDSNGRMETASSEKIMRTLGFTGWSQEKIEGETVEVLGDNNLGGGNVLNLADRNYGEMTVNFSNVRVEGDDYVINVWDRGGSDVNVDGMKYFLQPNAANGNSVLAYDVQNGEVRIPRDSIGGQMFSQQGDEVSFNGETQGVMEVDGNNFGTLRASLSGNRTMGEMNLTEATAGGGETTVQGETTYDYVFRGEDGRELRITSPEKQYTDWTGREAEFNAVHYRGDGLGRSIELESSVQMQNGTELHNVVNVGGHNVEADYTYLEGKLEPQYESSPLGRGLVDGDGRLTGENIGQVDAGELWQRNLSRITTSARKSELLDVAMGDRKDIGSMTQVNELGRLYEMNDRNFDEYNNGVMGKFMERVKEYTPRLSAMEGGHRSSAYVMEGPNGEMTFVASPNVANRETDVILTLDKMEGGSVIESQLKDSPELRQILGTPANAIVHQTGYNPNCGQLVQTWDYPEGTPIAAQEPGIPEENVREVLRIEEPVDDTTPNTDIGGGRATREAVKKAKKAKKAVEEEREEIVPEQQQPEQQRPQNQEEKPSGEQEEKKPGGEQPEEKPEEKPEDNPNNDPGDKPGDKPGEDDPGEDDPGEDDPGEDDPGEDDPGEDDPIDDDPIDDDPNLTQKNESEAGNMNDGYRDQAEVTGPAGENQRDPSREYNRETGTYDDPANQTDNPAASENGGYEQSGADRESTTMTPEEQKELQRAIEEQQAADNEYESQQQEAQEAIEKGPAEIAREQEEEGFMQGYKGGDTGEQVVVPGQENNNGGTFEMENNGAESNLGGGGGNGQGGGDASDVTNAGGGGDASDMGGGGATKLGDMGGDAGDATNMGGGANDANMDEGVDMGGEEEMEDITRDVFSDDGVINTDEETFEDATNNMGDNFGEMSMDEETFEDVTDSMGDDFDGMSMDEEVFEGSDLDDALDDIDMDETLVDEVDEIIENE